MGRLQPEPQPAAACLSRTASSGRSQSSDTNITTAPWPAGLVLAKPSEGSIFLSPTKVENNNSLNLSSPHNLELQLSTTSTSSKKDEEQSTQLQLSIGSSDFGDKNESNNTSSTNNKTVDVAVASRLKEEAREQLRVAMNEKAFAEEARKQAKGLMLMAEQEFANAKRIRQQAIAELERVQAIKDHAVRRINSTILQITCHSCKQQFQARTPTTTAAAENSLVLGYVVSSGVAAGGEVENDDRRRTLGRATSNTL